MRRALGVAAGALVAVVLLSTVAFQLWLRQQPPETRYAVEAMSLAEFAAAVRHQFFPRPMPDNADYGRVLAPGRGHAPWVLRSSLDGRPRMLSLALAPETWLAYATQDATLHQLWRGQLAFSGPAYDARHGNEPMSEGVAWLAHDATLAWQVREAKGWRPARVQWRGHGFAPDGGAAWIRYSLFDAAGREAVVTEWPEWQSGAEAEASVFVRRFEVAPSGAPELAIALAGPAPEIAGAGRFG